MLKTTPQAQVNLVSVLEKICSADTLNDILHVKKLKGQ